MWNNHEIDDSEQKIQNQDNLSFVSFDSGFYSGQQYLKKDIQHSTFTMK